MQDPLKLNQAPKSNLKKIVIFLILTLAVIVSFFLLKPKTKSEASLISPLELPTTTLIEPSLAPEKTPTLTSDKSISPFPLTTPAWSKHISLDSGFSLEYPGGWILEEDQDGANAIEPKPSGFPSSGKISIWTFDNNQETDIEKWFDNNFALKPNQAVTRRIPEKIRVFINKNKVKILEARSNFNSRIEYHFLSNYAGKRIVLAGYFPSEKNPEKEASLTALYSKIAESIELQE